MNKYAEFSQRAQEQRILERSCLFKKRYETYEKAKNKNSDMRVYKCYHCQGYHRSGQFIRIGRQGSKWLNNLRRES